jgi:hypothetical protein
MTTISTCSRTALLSAVSSGQCRTRRIGGSKPNARLDVRLRANVLQNLVAEHIRTALASLGEKNDLVDDGLLDIVGAVPDTQSDAERRRRVRKQHLGHV